jgi:hypothetical protein
MEIHGCTHTNIEEGKRSRQCYHNGAYSHSSVNMDVGLSTERAQEGVVQWSVICKGHISIMVIFKWIITIMGILSLEKLLFSVCPVNKITYTKWHKPIYTRKVCQMGTTCILHQISLYVALTKLTLIAFTLISEDILFVSCIHWQNFQSLWSQKTWQEYTRSCMKWKCLHFFASERSSSILSNLAPRGLERCQIIKYSRLLNGTYTDLNSYR